LGERWIRDSKKLLRQIEELETIEDRDRLELVRSTRFMLGVLERSLVGWMQWVVNPDIMAKFSQEELKEINSNISKFVRSFVEYDLKITKLGAQKGLKAKKKRERETTENRYVA